MIKHPHRPLSCFYYLIGVKVTPIFCRNCDHPECAYTCMTGAMHKNDITGFVDYDKNHCASCYMCIMNCPYGVLQTDEETGQVIMKCDMCNHKLDGPMCVGLLQLHRTCSQICTNIEAVF